MKHNINTLRGITLLTASAILCLGAGAAQCQRAGRTASRVSGGQGSANQGTACPNGTMSQSGSTSATSNTSTTALSNAVSLNAQSNQASGTVSAFRTSANQLSVQWSGSTSNVQRIYLGVLNANGQVLAQRAITKLPVQANLTVTSAARYYGVKVVYSNGTSNTIYRPLR